jgi:hypothetical protein
MQPNQQRDTSVDLLHGVDAAIEKGLGVSKYDSRKAALILSGRKPLGLDGVSFVRSVFDPMRENWDRALACSPAGSLHNFRWHAPQLHLSPHNRSPEVTLERRLMAACQALGRTDWSNQVPLVSGITDSHAGKRRAIDLVYHRPSGGFELVELKVGSDTPVYAALEILQYGILWLLSRRDRHRLGYEGRPIIEATSVQLSVLAPRPFFAPFDLRELASALDTGLRILGAEWDVELGFSQWAFRPDFEWSSTSAMSDRELIDLLDTREPV